MHSPRGLAAALCSAAVLLAACAEAAPVSSSSSHHVHTSTSSAVPTATQDHHGSNQTDSGVGNATVVNEIFKLRAPAAPEGSQCVRLDSMGGPLTMGDCDKRLTDFPYAVYTLVPGPVNGTVQFLEMHEWYYNRSECMGITDNTTFLNADDSNPEPLQNYDCSLPSTVWVFDNSTGQIRSTDPAYPDACLQFVPLYSGELLLGHCSNKTAAEDQSFVLDYEGVYVDVSVGENETGVDVTPDVVEGKQYAGQDPQTMIDTHTLTCDEIEC